MLFEKLYGKSHVEAETGRLVVVENPELLAAPPPPPIVGGGFNPAGPSTPTQSSQPPPSNTTPGGGGPSPVSSSGGLSSSAPRSAISRQIETRTKDGRRRITPVYIPTNPDQRWELFSTDSIKTTIGEALGSIKQYTLYSK
jgi:protein HIRA/HIR1